MATTRVFLTKLRRVTFFGKKLLVKEKQSNLHMTTDHIRTIIIAMKEQSLKIALAFFLGFLVGIVIYLVQNLEEQNKIMKKIRFILLLLVVGMCNDVLSQNDSMDYDPRCYRETDMVKIENVEEFLYKSKKSLTDDSQIVFYVITGRYVDPQSKNYGEQIRLVSLDTISMQSETRTFTHVNGISRQNTIRIGESYRFHLRLWGCVIYQLGPIPEFHMVEDVQLPVKICPHQPYKAMELKGLNYITQD